MVKTCEYILPNNRYCKNYCRYSCNLNKMHKLCSVHGSMMLSKYAELIQHWFKNCKVSRASHIFVRLPYDLKQYILQDVIYSLKLNNIYNLYANFISKRINVSLNTINWCQLIYNRYDDIYTYFNDSESIYYFCRLLELINKYFLVIRDRVNLKNIKFICSELQKIYLFNQETIEYANSELWFSVIKQINLLRKLKIRISN